MLFCTKRHSRRMRRGTHAQFGGIHVSPLTGEPSCWPPAESNKPISGDKVSAAPHPCRAVQQSKVFASIVTAKAMGSGEGNQAEGGVTNAPAMLSNRDTSLSNRDTMLSNRDKHTC